MTEPNIPLNRCAYLAGRATLPGAGLPGLVEGINFLRDHGVAIWAGSYAVRGQNVLVPLAVRCDADPFSTISGVGAIDTTKNMVKKVLDGCTLAWKEVRPHASSQKSIRLCRRADAVAKDPSHLTLADITPAAAVDDPFRNLVGMKPQVELLRTISDAAAAYGRGSLESLHMVFEGKPGTGKTELARRTSAYMHKSGLTTGKFVKVSAADLIAKYVGQTPGLVRDAFDRAEGGVLFVDEAYSLTQGRGNEFGVEAVNALVECMDERRDRVVVIAAGYPREMEEFLSSNAGLRDRFGFVVDFDDFTVRELASIYRTFAKEKDFRVTDDACQDLEDACKDLMGLEHFSGARSVRKLFVRSVMAAAQAHPGERVLSAEDIAAALAQTDDKPARNRLGFA